MKIFLDTTKIDEIEMCDRLGFLDGVTTNPLLVGTQIGYNKKEIFDRYRKICDICGDRPVSLEVNALTYDAMLKEAEELLKFGKNVCIKLPITEDGLKTCQTLSKNGIAVNMTLCFSPLQALLCAKSGAKFVSPFIGRLDDISHNGIKLIEDIRKIFDNYPEYCTEILAASIRNSIHITEVAKIGADVVTVPWNIILQMIKHPLTNIGLQQFLSHNKEGIYE